MISKRYIREKWDSLKWDIENVLKIYDTTENKISEEDIKRVKGDIEHCLEALRKELIENEN